MAITKLGAQILGGTKKTGSVGVNRPAFMPELSRLEKMGSVSGLIGSFAMPGLMTFGAVNTIASGEQSVGESIGELGGGLAGWSLGSKAFGSMAKNMKPGKLKTALGVASGFLGSGIGASVASVIGNTILPFRRKPKNPTNYWQDGYNGWNGQPYS